MLFAGQTFDAVLFDMDGTLLTSIPAVERAWTAWARRVGGPVDDILHYLHGRTAVDTIARFAPDGADIAAEVAWLDARELADMDGVVAIPGAADLLAALPQAGWAVVTSANRELAHRRIAAAGLPLPRVLVSSGDVLRGKPDPEGYLSAARQLGARISHSLVVEDTSVGLAAGRAAGASLLRVLGTETTEALPDIPALHNYLDLRLTVRPHRPDVLTDGKYAQPTH